MAPTADNRKGIKANRKDGIVMLLIMILLSSKLSKKDKKRIMRVMKTVSKNYSTIRFGVVSELKLCAQRSDLENDLYSCVQNTGAYLLLFACQFVCVSGSEIDAFFRTFDCTAFGSRNEAATWRKIGSRIAVVWKSCRKRIQKGE